MTSRVNVRRGLLRLVGLTLLFALVLHSSEVKATEADACVDAATEGQRVRDRGRLIASRDRFLECAQASCPALVSDACTKWLRQVQERIPTVVFRARDRTGADLTDVAVSVDGSPLMSALTGRAVELDPGPHRLAFERRGTRVERDLVLAEGEKGRIIVVSWPDDAPARSGAKGLAPRHDHPKKSDPLPPAFWASAGGGVLALGGGVFFGLSGMKDADALRESCAPRCPEADRDDVARKLVVADILFAASIVFGAVATYIALTNESAAPQSASTKTSSKTTSMP